jgi:hypothetical protein
LLLTLLEIIVFKVVYIGVGKSKRRPGFRTTRITSAIANAHSLHLKVYSFVLIVLLSLLFFVCF